MSFGVEQWKCVSHCVFTGMVAEGLPREGPCFRESAQDCRESSIGGKMRKKLKATKLVTKMRSEKCASDCSGTLICQKNEALGVAEKSALYTLRACWPIWHDAPATREIAGAHVEVAKRIGTAVGREVPLSLSNVLEQLGEDKNWVT